jgi:hypothetical protein
MPNLDAVMLNLDTGTPAALQARGRFFTSEMMNVLPVEKTGFDAIFKSQFQSFFR